jgi:2-haloacid dehalogenase
MPDDKLKGTTACVFDAYGTLLDTSAAARRSAAALGGKAEPLARLWRQKQLEYTWLRSLMRRHADFWQVTGDALDYAMASFGIADDALRGRLMEQYRVLDAYPEAKPLLAALRRAGRPTAILSNGTPEMLRAAVAAAGIADLLDHVVSVEEAGIYKPDPAVYALATARLGRPAAELCFVSANGWDAAGAAACGLNAVWINRAGAAGERLPAAPVAEIASLAALPALLGL